MLKKIIKIIVASCAFFMMQMPVLATDYFNVNVGYQGQNDGVWTDFAYGGALAGTEGGDPLDSLEIHLVDSPYASGVEYRVYTASGWSEWFSTWQRANHNNEDILGLQIQLKDFPNANVYYQSYRKGLGWGIWVSNGSTSGQLNSAYPITGFRVKVDEIGVNYQSSIGGVTQVLRANGETQGTGSLETVSMNLISADSGSIEYRAYIRNSGWTNWASNGSVLGSSGSIIEAIEARLVDLPQYSVQIQPQVEGEWWGYVYDGQTAGAPGINKALTAYRIEIVQRVYVAPAPATTVSNTSTDLTAKFIWASDGNLDFLVNVDDGNDATTVYYNFMTYHNVELLNDEQSDSEANRPFTETIVTTAYDSYTGTYIYYGELSGGSYNFGDVVNLYRGTELEHSLTLSLSTTLDYQLSYDGDAPTIANVLNGVSGGNCTWYMFTINTTAGSSDYTYTEIDEMECVGINPES